MILLQSTHRIKRRSVERVLSRTASSHSQNPSQRFQDYDDTVWQWLWRLWIQWLLLSAPTGAHFVTMLCNNFDFPLSPHHSATTQPIQTYKQKQTPPISQLTHVPVQFKFLWIIWGPVCTCTVTVVFWMFFVFNFQILCQHLIDVCTETLAKNCSLQVTSEKGSLSRILFFGSSRILFFRSF